MAFKLTEIVAVITDALFVKKLKFILYSMTKRNMCKGKGHCLDNDLSLVFVSRGKYLLFPLKNKEKHSFSMSDVL